MNAHDFTVGQRVRIVAASIAIFDLGTFPAGLTGTVVAATPDAAAFEAVASVRLDKHFAELNDWQNELMVFRPEDGECTAADFEPVVAARLTLPMEA